MKRMTFGVVVGLTSLTNLLCAPVYTRTNITTVSYRGVVNKPLTADIDSTLSGVIEFWSQHYPRRSVEACLKQWRFIFSDDEKICQLGVCGRALTYSHGASIIGYKREWGYVQALIGHEAGHAVLSCVGVPDEKQHERMSELNFVHR